MLRLVLVLFLLSIFILFFSHFNAFSLPSGGDSTALGESSHSLSSRGENGEYLSSFFLFFFDSCASPCEEILYYFSPLSHCKPFAVRSTTPSRPAPTERCGGAVLEYVDLRGGSLVVYHLFIV